MTTPTSSRRDFFETVAVGSALLHAASYSRAVGANDRIRFGVIGCGAIAQIQHLPHLRELADEFSIGGLADLSPRLLEAVGEEYGVPPERRFLDYHDLVRSDIDGVIACPSGSPAAPRVAPVRGHPAQGAPHRGVRSTQTSSADGGMAIRQLGAPAW